MIQMSNVKSLFQHGKNSSGFLLHIKYNLIIINTYLKSLLKILRKITTFWSKFLDTEPSRLQLCFN